MVRHCQVCKKNSWNYSNLSFHRFPTNMETRSIWLALLGLSETQTRRFPKRPEICGEHFERSDFSYRRTGRKFLNKNANPKLVTNFNLPSVMCYSGSHIPQQALTPKSQLSLTLTDSCNETSQPLSPDAPRNVGLKRKMEQLTQEIKLKESESKSSRLDMDIKQKSYPNQAEIAEEVDSDEPSELNDESEFKPSQIYIGTPSSNDQEYVNENEQCSVESDDSIDIKIEPLDVRDYDSKSSLDNFNYSEIDVKKEIGTNSDNLKCDNSYNTDNTLKNVHDVECRTTIKQETDDFSQLNYSSGCFTKMCTKGEGETLQG